MHKQANIAEQARVARQEDAQLCRLYLGIDGPDFHQRQLMMACAHDVVDKNRIGNKRFDAATKAWNQCMPDLTVCKRALR